MSQDHPGPIEIVGELQTGMMAIGGETTGVVLRVAPGQKGYAGPSVIELSGLQGEQMSLSGRRVRVRGRLTIKRYVERGATPILIVEHIAPVTDDS